MQLQVRVGMGTRAGTDNKRVGYMDINLVRGQQRFRVGGRLATACDGQQVPHRYRTGRLAWTGTRPGTGSRQAQAQEQEQPRHSTGWLATVPSTPSILSRTLRGPAFAG